MKKRLIFPLILLILLSTLKPRDFNLPNKFNIKELEIKNIFILKENEINKDLAFLYETNLFFLEFKNIQKILKKNNFIESFEIKKIYPNKLKIKVYEKKPIAILYYKKKKYYINQDTSLIDYTDVANYKDLPVIFGNKESFTILYKNLKKINFPLELIKKYQLYESLRWDIEIYKNKIIKLPIKNYNQSLKNFMILRRENNLDKYNVFDYRINNQLILK